MPSSDTMKSPLDPNIKVAFDGKTKLCEVIEEGNLEMLNQFLKDGLDPEQKLYNDKGTHHAKFLVFQRPSFIPYDAPEYEGGCWRQRHHHKKFVNSVSAQKYAEYLPEAAERAVVF